jgi:inorganic phosphate transporter, PiT family
VIVAVIAVTLVFVFLSGLNDSGALVAASISSGAIAPRQGLLLAALAAFVGFFLFESSVAATIGRDLVESSAITPGVLLVTIASATAWILVAAYFGLPSSSTHALLGGLIGAVTLTSGPNALLLAGFVKVLVALFFAPVIGFAAGYAFMRLTLSLTRGAPPHINEFFKQFQPLNVVALAVSYGANDGQKGVALITMALVASAYQSNFQVPLWVKLVCAATLAIGVGAGGWRTMRTIGRRIYKLRPVHAFTAQNASAIIVLTAALLGGPVSTPQVVSTSIIGVGTAERINSVRWGIAGAIVRAWILTIPASALVAAALTLVVSRIGI